MIGNETEIYNGLFLRVICEDTQFKIGFIYNCRIYDESIIFRTRCDEYSTKQAHIVINKKHSDHIAIDNVKHEVLLYVTDNYEIRILNYSTNLGSCVRYYNIK